MVNHPNRNSITHFVLRGTFVHLHPEQILDGKPEFAGEVRIMSKADMRAWARRCLLLDPFGKPYAGHELTPAVKQCCKLLGISVNAAAEDYAARKREIADETIPAIIKDICELPDYNSPDDNPDLLQCTIKELELILRRHLLGEE